MADEPTPPDAWDLKEEARRLSITTRHLRDMIKLHNAPILRAGRKILFDRHAHDSLIEAMRVRKEFPPPRNSISSRNQWAGSPPSLSADRAYERALALARRRSPKKPKPKGSRPKPKS